MSNWSKFFNTTLKANTKRSTESIITQYKLVNDGIVSNSSHEEDNVVMISKELFEKYKEQEKQLKKLRNKGE